MSPGGRGRSDVRQALIAEYRALTRSAARDTTLIAGLVALAFMPAWSLFDFLLVPDRAGSFLVVRLLSEAAILITCGALWWQPIGGRWPEGLSVLTVAIPELAIAWMIPRSGDEVEAYALGLTLAIFATAFLVVWRWPMTVALALVVGTAVTGFSLTADPGLTTRQATTVAFYLTTASALAIASQVYRERKAWSQHVTRGALEVEYQRNEDLVKELDQLAREDPLTSVGNRRAWEERVTGEFLRARRSGRPLSVIVCDFDRFKAINDDLGHNVGDAVLRTGASLLVSGVRATDFVARLGGDEFAVLCPDTSLAAAANVAAGVGERIRRATFPGEVAMTFSIGVAELEADDASTEDLYHRADCALYAAKVDRDTLRCAEPSRHGRRPAR